MNNYLDYDKLMGFSNRLDSHILECESFFSADLLEIIDSIFDYHCSAITIYEDDRDFQDIICHNITNTMQDNYSSSFNQKDPIAQYITNNFSKLCACSNKIIKSSDILDGNTANEYHDFMEKNGGIRYIAVIPFRKYRIGLYKNEDQGDFGPDEILNLNYIERILWSKYNLYLKVSKPQKRISYDELKNKYFDSLLTGVVILNSNYSVLDFNSISEQYISALSPGRNIENFFSNLIPLLNFPIDGILEQPIERITKFENYILKISLHKNLEYESSTNGFVYLIIISNSSAETSMIDPEVSMLNSRTSFQEKYGITHRELDIIDALANGDKYQEIANTLFISINTVRTHVKNIYRKLGIENQRQLLSIYNNCIK